ncbi:MAG: DUF4252 domain-containing protein [Bacteroidia bacterium]
MKTTIWIFCALLFVPFVLQAQSPAVTNFFDRYEGIEAYNSINFGGSLLGMISKDDNDSNIKLKSLKLINAPYNEGPINGTAINRFITSLENGRFEELDVENTGSGSIQFFMDEQGGMIKELVMVLQSETGYTVMSLRGLIPLDELEKLDAEVDIDGLEHLEGPY